MIAIILVGAVNFCLTDDQSAGGYCSASHTVQTLAIVIPAATITVGWGLSMRTARLSPAAIAAIVTVAEGLVVLAHWN